MLKDRLTFAYVDDNGVVQRKEVWNNLLLKRLQTSYMLVAVGELTAAEQTFSRIWKSKNCI
jgi:hypothetical protein